MEAPRPHKWTQTWPRERPPRARVGALGDPDYTKIRPAKLSAARRPTWTSVKEAGGKNGRSGRTQLCVRSAGFRIRKKAAVHVPLPPSPPPPALAPLASATLCVSGQISLTVGSAGLCGGLFILEHGLPSGSLHLSKHPPRPLLCVPGLAQPPPIPLPFPSLLPPHLQPAALPHTLFPTLSLLQPTVQSSPLRSLSSLCPVFLLLPGLGVFLTAPPALSPPDSVLTWMREKGRTVWSKKEAFQAHSQEITQCKTMARKLGLVGLNGK